MATPRVGLLPSILVFLTLAGCTEEETTVLPGSGPGPGDTGVDDGSDRDGDLLTDFVERNGWEVTLDEEGYGTDHLTVRRVTSDPGALDTDGDGLDDFEEYLIGSDPRLADTDRDQLDDLAEWTRWITNPLSADSDGDARGPGGSATPNPALFDGFELSRSHTSPSLADTDGDGRTDGEELDDPVRRPLVAEVPDLEVAFVGDTVVRLDVEYQESVGETSQYGTTLSQSQSTAEESSVTTTAKSHVNVTLGAEYKFGGTDSGATVKGEVEGGHEWGSAVATSFTDQSSATQEYSRLQGDSLTRTETASSGFLSQGLTLENTGSSAFELASLSFTVLQWRADVTGDTAGDFQAVATLLPEVEGITLSPGERTDVIQVVARDVNASLVKEFLAQPNTLHCSTSLAEFEDARGINFDFLTQNTGARTAELILDFGAGRVERYRVATNVARGPGGTYEGLRMGAALRDVLGIPYETRESSATPGEFVLSRVREADTVAGNGAGFLPRAAWTILTASDEQAAPGVSFDDIVLLAGQRIVLSYSLDEDQDGLFRDEESLYGCSDDTRHSDADAAHPDGDGLDDAFEIRDGWQVGPIVDPELLPAQTSYSVRSSPIAMDSDGDGLGDDEELAQHTDPRKPDTDGDGLSDGVEVEQGLQPLVRAPRLHVDQARGTSAGPGTSWGVAFAELREALADAALRRASPDRGDDVSEIWVAAGTYLPSEDGDASASFQLLPLVSVYGGFTGVETKRDQRDEDPVFNGCVLDGAGDAQHVVVAADPGLSCTLDGFLVTGGDASDPLAGPGRRGGGLAVSNGASPTLRNMLFRLNRATDAGGAAWVAGGSVRFEDCLFDQNRCTAGSSRGGAVLLEDTDARFVDCRFTDNESGGRGGAVFSFQHGGQKNVFERCTFRRNNNLGPAGTTLYLSGARHRIAQCRFLQNGSTEGATGRGTVFNSCSRLEIVQSVFWANAAGLGGGVTTREMDRPDPSVPVSDTRLVGCTLAGNQPDALDAVSDRLSLSIESSILWGNGSDAHELSEINTGRPDYDPGIDVRTSCIEGLDRFAAPGNLGSDPSFASLANGNLRLRADSPCIDAGNGLADFGPFEPGFQPAPSGDLDGGGRTADGDGDGEAVIDMGAYEFQG